MPKTKPNAKSFTIQLYNRAKSERFAEKFDRIAFVTTGSRTSLFESMANMLFEKIAAGAAEWQALDETTDAFAARFLAARKAHRPKRASHPTEDTTPRDEKQAERTFG